MIDGDEDKSFFYINGLAFRVKLLEPKFIKSCKLWKEVDFEKKYNGPLCIINLFNEIFFEKETTIFISLILGLVHQKFF